MFDTRIASKVQNLLKKKLPDGLKFQTIKKILNIKSKKNLSHTLRKLVKTNRIIKKNKKYYSRKPKKHKTFTGRFDATALIKDNSYAFVRCDDFDVFVPAENISSAYHKDKVLVEIDSLHKKRKRGRIIQVLERNKTTFVGTVFELRRKLYISPDYTKIHTYFSLKSSEAVEPDTKVLVKISNWGGNNLNSFPKANLVEVIGKAGDPEVELISVLKDFDLPLEFPENVKKELETLTAEIKEADLNKRHDLRKLTTLTIDPKSAKDYDDAISLKNQNKKKTLYVHIADVSHYFAKGSALFKEAKKRGNSYYFPKKVIPMLPPELSNQICSLRPNEDKLTITVETVFNHNLEIQSQQVYRSIINSDVRLTYAEVDRLFENKKPEIDKAIVKQLQSMRKLSKHLQEKRYKGGYLFFDLPEIDYLFDENGMINDLQRTAETESHKLIENFMLLANEYIAHKLSQADTMFRIHEKPEKRDIDKLHYLAKSYDKIKFNPHQNLHKAIQGLLQSLPNKDYHRVFDRKILRSMKKAKYAIQNKGHFGLAMQKYTHFTSPIRRLCDLVIHYQIKRKIDKKENPFDKNELENLAEIASEKERLADDAEREYDIKNKMTFMKKKVGNLYNGLIININPNGLIIELDKYPITGIIPFYEIDDDYYQYYEKYYRAIGKNKGKVFNLADRVKVQINKVTDDIYLLLKERC